MCSGAAIGEIDSFNIDQCLTETDVDVQAVSSGAVADGARVAAAAADGHGSERGPAAAGGGGHAGANDDAAGCGAAATAAAGQAAANGGPADDGATNDGAADDGATDDGRHDGARHDGAGHDDDGRAAARRQVQIPLQGLRRGRALAARRPVPARGCSGQDGAGLCADAASSRRPGRGSGGRGHRGRHFTTRQKIQNKYI
jgi:hypothetical protein